MPTTSAASPSPPPTGAAGAPRSGQDAGPAAAARASTTTRSAARMTFILPSLVLDDPRSVPRRLGGRQEAALRARQHRLRGAVVRQQVQARPEMSLRVGPVPRA